MIMGLVIYIFLVIIGVIFYVIYYILVKGNLFLIGGLIGRKYGII